MGLFDKFFVREDAEQEGRALEMQMATEFLEWARMPYHGRFLAWLDEQIDKPLDTSTAQEVLRSAERGNTFREIKKHLRTKVQYAAAALKEYEEEAHVGP